MYDWMGWGVDRLCPYFAVDITDGTTLFVITWFVENLMLDVL